MIELTPFAEAQIEITRLRQRVKELEEYNIAQGDALEKLRAENNRLRQIWRGKAGSSFGPPRTGEPL